MGGLQKVGHEVLSILLLTLYFAVWIGTLVLIKTLVLAQYEIEYTGLSVALVGALILAKVVLILEHVPLGPWIERQPAAADVVLRTILYTFGVAVVLLLEKSFEGRHEHGGFANAAASLLKGIEVEHIVVNIICVSAALLSYNVMAVVRDHLGVGALRRIFLASRAPCELSASRDRGSEKQRGA